MKRPISVGSGRIATPRSSRRNNSPTRVVGILPATTSGMAATIDLTIDAIKSLAEQTGQDAVKWLQDKNIRAELHIATGYSVETIVSEAKRLNCDAIVLGHRHCTFWMRLLEQSTCEVLLDAATCPLMITR
ncbi:universal stress protein [uncultured Desulfovibrio sp.]|uniref:universal stress protein n=1 Tax=uncultured Desulfovibrio sp. TaxID=167968 RepID=UPI00345D2CF1